MFFHTEDYKIEFRILNTIIN
uniref:Uncharacterized protein n=1 Tax=Rhizophora mucronata TaxID=61149 RepID=A0A2P2QY84_RHIMU